MYIVMLGSLTSTLFYIGQHDFHYQYELTTGAIVLVSALVGIIISNRIVSKLGRPSILIFLLGAVAIVSALIIPVLEINDLVQSA